MNKYGFFSSLNGDRKYSAEDFCGYFKDIFTDGVLGNSAANLKVSPSGGMEISVAAGTAYIQGHFFRPEAAEKLEVSPSDISYGRKDRVVIRLDRDLRMVYTKIITGTPSDPPAAPDIVRDGAYYDIGIAVIDIAANAAEVTSADITDTRFDTSVCGIVTGTIDTIDTSDLFAQYEARWDLLMAGFSGDEAAIVAAFNALLTVKSINGVAPVDSGGNITLTQGDIPSGNGSYQIDKLMQCGTVNTSSETGYASVTFDVPYTSKPVVVASCVNSANHAVAILSNVSETGFSVRTRSLGDVSVSSAVNWIAMGV